MWVVAHRGGAELYPENSITAFRELTRLGVDLVECDVHLSKDGHLVTIHDANLLRTAGVNRRVEDLTLDELRHVNVGDGNGVPALVDVLTTVDIPVVVELKKPETVQALERLLREHPEYIDRIVPLSFYHEILLYLTSNFPSLNCGALLAGFPVNPVQVATSAGCRLLSFHYEGLQKSYVDKCHDGGIMVSVWTPNTCEDIRRMLDAGVDGIGSDRPDLVLEVIAEENP